MELAQNLLKEKIQKLELNNIGKNLLELAHNLLKEKIQKKTLY